MKGITVAIMQAKLYLYEEELEWLEIVVKKQRTAGGAIDRRNSEQLLETIVELKEVMGSDIIRELDK